MAIVATAHRPAAIATGAIPVAPFARGELVANASDATTTRSAFREREVARGALSGARGRARR